MHYKDSPYMGDIQLNKKKLKKINLDKMDRIKVVHLEACQESIEETLKAYEVTSFT